MVWLIALDLTLGITALALGVLLLVADARRSANRSLAILLLVEGVGWFGLAAAASDAGLPFGGWSETVQRASIAASPWLYAWFVVHTLDVPLTRPFAGRAVRRSLVAAAIVVPVLLIGFLAGNATYQRISDFVGISSGPNIIIATWALAAAIQHFKRTDNRRQSAAYVAAFTARNIALLAFFGAVLLAKQTGDIGFLSRAVAAVKAMLFMHLAFLVYGVLSGQVLGLDDKVRVTIQKALVLTVVAGIFLILTEGTEMVVGAESPVMAIVAAGVITLVFQPVQAGAMRLAEKVLPGSVPSNRLPRRVRRKLYQEQATIAWADGEVRGKEREMLERLRRELEIGPDEAAVLEHAARSGDGSAAGSARD